MLRNILFLILFIPVSCISQEEAVPKKTGTLPAGIEESSGLEICDDETFYTHNDGDGELNLYKIDKYGNMTEYFTIENVKVKDVEDIARDQEGNLYLGDFGNNECERKKFTILKVFLPEGGFSIPIAKEIDFTLPDNRTDHHKKEDRNFDMEAMFHHNGWIYIFTKDRSEPSMGFSKMYKVPDEEGRYTATYIGKVQTSNDNDKGVITAADISPDGSKVVLLAKKGAYVLSNFKGDDFHLGMKEFVPFSFKSQKEAVVFTDNCNLAITDEYANKKGGKIYQMDLCTALFKLREENLKK